MNFASYWVLATDATYRGAVIVKGLLTHLVNTTAAKVLATALGAAIVVGGGAVYVATSTHTSAAGPASLAATSAPIEQTTAARSPVPPNTAPAPGPLATVAPAPPAKSKATPAKPATSAPARDSHKTTPRKSAGDLSTPEPPAQPADTQPPTAPANLIAYPQDRVVCLAWADSMDNVGVAGYRVYRDGAQIPLEHGPGACAAGYEDRVGCALTTHAYKVVAYDAAGNVSAPAETVGGPAWCPI